MTDSKHEDQAVSSVIEFYRAGGHSDAVLTAIKELLIKSRQHTQQYDTLAAYFDTQLQIQGVYYDSANIYLLMMNALLKFSEYCQGG
jgi:hypothetical protein